jgi:predicted transposase YbfD/YdcC
MRKLFENLSRSLSMSQPKGRVPAHIKHKKFQHPNETDHVILILNEVEDPRKPSCNFHHSLTTILFISLMGVLCGAKDWEEIAQAAHGMADWIGKHVDISAGIPSSKTLKRVMSLIPTKSLDSLLQGIRSAIGDLAGDIVAIDGKTLRGSRGWNEDSRPLHLLHAWSTELGVCLGQVSVDEKSNEITAFPELIESLELKGTVVTTDALNTQKKGAKAIVSKGADYVLPVKENHKDLYDDIKLLFEDADKKEFKGIDAADSHSLEKSAGRLEERYYELVEVEDLPAAKEWEGCLSFGRVTRRRTKKGKTSEEVCFYITSLDLDIEKFARSVREHWGVENRLHLPLDVVFEEDKHRYQDKVGAANLSLLRKVALGVLTKDSSLKCGRPAKQMRAATSSAYRDHLIKNCF